MTETQTVSISGGGGQVVINALQPGRAETWRGPGLQSSGSSLRGSPIGERDGGY